MQKSIKDTFIENMIMQQHGEKIKQVQELMIERLQKSKQSIERFIISEVANSNDAEALNEYKLRLKAVEELLHKVRNDFLNVDLDTIFMEVAWNNKKEYEELVEALERPSKCESCAHTYEEDSVDKVKEVLDKEWIKVSDEFKKEANAKLEEVEGKVVDEKLREAEELGEKIADAVRIFVNVTQPDNTNKVNATEWAKKLSEALKNNRAGW